MPASSSFLDVLPAFGVLAARGVGVGELVDQHHLWLPLQHRVDVEFGKLASAVVDVARRDDLDALDQVGGLLAAVGLDDRGDHIGAALQPAVRLAEHRVRLADAGRRAQVDAQLAALLLVVGPVGQRLVGCHMIIIHRTRQLLAGYFWSSSRLSFSTLTAGLTEESEPASVGVVRDGLPDLVGADAARLGDPVDLQIGIGDRDVRVEAAAAGGDGVGGHLRVGRRAAADRHDLADAVVLAELGALDAHTLVGVEERRRRRVARFVDADHLRRVDDVAARVARADHRQHGADAVAGAERA